MALLARTRNGEKRILNRLYMEAQLAKRVINPILLTGLSAQQLLVHACTFADPWSEYALSCLAAKLLCISFVVWVVTRILAECWFDLRTLLSFFWLQVHKYLARLKRIPPTHLRLFARLTFWFLIYTTPLPKNLFIRAGPRPPKHSPFALFMRAPLLVAP